LGVAAYLYVNGLTELDGATRPSSEDSVLYTSAS
jgi:hypothetical protein